MELDMFEGKMLKDAVVEHWHNTMSKSNNEQVKKRYKDMMQDIKAATNSTQRHVIVINK